MTGAGAETRDPFSRNVDRTARWVRRRRGLAALRSGGDPAFVALAEAIEAGRLSRFSREEREWVERIEGLRAGLESSTEIVRTVAAELSGDPADSEVFEDVVGDVCRAASHPPLWAGILLSLVRRLRPKRCLELGSCLGLSAAYQGAALELNGEGRMISLEGARGRAELAARHLRRLGLDRVEVRSGRFAETLGPALADLGAVDYAFIDGHHDEMATEEYFRGVAEVVASPGVLVFDDIRWSEGMKRAWAKIQADPAVKGSADLGPVGICVLGEGSRRGAVGLPIA